MQKLMARNANDFPPPESLRSRSREKLHSPCSPLHSESRGGKMNIHFSLFLLLSCFPPSQSQSHRHLLQFSPVPDVSISFVPTASPSEIPSNSPSPPPSPFPTWCVAKPSVPDDQLQDALDYACGTLGADCDHIRPGGACFNPDTLLAHASFAFNSYWQRRKKQGGTCDFNGLAIIVASDPSIITFILNTLIINHKLCQKYFQHSLCCRF